MLKTIFAAVLAINVSCAFGQANSATMTMTAAIPAEKVKLGGTVVAPDGSPVAGANVVLTRGDYMPNAVACVTKKDGTFSLMTVGGRWFMDVSAPGFEKSSSEVDVDMQSQTSPKIVLRPRSGAETSGKGNKIVVNNIGFQMTVNASHPAYEGKTLADVVEDMPAVELFFAPASVMHSEEFEVYVNGDAVKVAPEKLRSYFASIPAQSVKSLKATAKQDFMKQPAALYISTK